MNETNNQQPMAANKKNLIISGVVILAVLVALFVAPKMRAPSEEVATDESTLPEGCKPGYKFSETTGKPCPAEASEASGPSTALSRADATARYEGSTIRFSMNEEGECIATLEKFESTPGKTVMIDNDTDARRTIMVGAKSYSVGARRYTLSSMNMGLGEHVVSCDGNAASTITIK